MSSSPVQRARPPTALRVTSAFAGAATGFAIFATGALWLLDSSIGDQHWAAGSLAFALVTPIAALLTFRAAQHARRPLLAVAGAGLATAAIAGLVTCLWFGLAISHGVG